MSLESTATDYTFDHTVVDPGDTSPVELDLYDECALFWQANKQYSAGNFIRPTRATGYSYECTVSGTSAAREPRSWPTTGGATQTDGSVTWTCRAAGSSGLNAITSPSAVSEPTGMTIASVTVVESTKIQARYSGGVDGQSFDAVYTFTLDGLPRVARQRVYFRKR